MDLDAPELIQALEDFTKQILSPGNLLSRGLEEAISSQSTSNSAPATHETSQGEQSNGSGLTSQVEEVANQQEDAEMMHVEILTSNTEEVNSPYAATEENLPLNEPVFQILSEIFEDYQTSTKLQTQEVQSSIPQDEKSSDTINFICNNSLKKENDSLSTFLESYPYDSWDSPGSVESEILFPELF